MTLTGRAEKVKIYLLTAIGRKSSRVERDNNQVVALLRDSVKKGGLLSLTKCDALDFRPLRGQQNRRRRLQERREIYGGSGVLDFLPLRGHVSTPGITDTPSS